METRLDLEQDRVYLRFDDSSDVATSLPLRRPQTGNRDAITLERDAAGHLVAIAVDAAHLHLTQPLLSGQFEPLLEWDQQVDAAYLYLTPKERCLADETVVVEVDDEVMPWEANFDFDADGHLVGIEFLEAEAQIPAVLLSDAKRI